MAKPAIGAVVRYCGHDGVFIADIFLIDKVNVVRANGPVNPGNIKRKGELGKATHQLSDFPACGYWGAERGVFVVPEKQVTVLR